MKNILGKSNQRVLLLGNEAIIRGALEVGVDFVSTYPGTPASEIGDRFNEIVKSQPYIAKNLYFEFSVNEKVALEAGVGASYCGLKTLVAMKNFGLNVCQDALLPFVYTGSKGPTVIVVADDPSCHSSAQSEQNSRPTSYLAHLPTLEPSTPQECKDFIHLGFEISEKFKIPVMLRLTTRVAHQRAIVKLDKLVECKTKGKFIKDKNKFVTMPPRVLGMKEELLEKIEKIRDFSELSPINKISRGQASANLGIITSGVSYLYVVDALEELGLNLPVLKIGMFYPLLKKKIIKFIKPLKKVLIVEELEPWLEKEINVLAKNVNPKLKVFGKNILPITGELSPDIVLKAMAVFSNKKIKPLKENKVLIPKRYPQPCPGCPYWLAFNAVKQAVDTKKVVFGGDIGCYMLAGTPCIALQDYLSCMGSSIGIAHGIKKSSSQKLITFIGDSTFFHAGIPALINTVFNNSSPLIIVMDNQTTAMTGHQPNPGNKIKIEDIVKACGVKNLKVINPVKQKEMVETIKNFIKKDEVSVIISRSPCLFIK